MTVACITIDLDSIDCYRKIYGLETDEEDNSIYEVGLERFVNLMEEYGLKGTLFVVGRDLAMGDNRRVLNYLASQGFEIANHSYSHDYALTRMSPEKMLQDILMGKQAIEKAVGMPVQGFRAPGYNITDELLDVIEHTGHLYDSSVFPCLPYYLTKATALAYLQARGRPSHSIMGNPAVLAAPLGPYHPKTSAFWRRGDRELWEMPISTSPILRLPFLGSFIVLMRRKWFPMLYSMLKLGSPCLVLEFHGMDFMDGVADGLDVDLLRQPDVAVGWEKKERLYRKVLESLKAQCDVVPLGEAIHYF